MKRTVMAVSALALVVAACGGEPAARVAVPGAPPGGDTRPPVSTAAPIETAPPATDAPSETTADPATTPAPATTAGPATTTATTIVTTTTVAATTTVPPTTVPATTTTVAPTTTELVYSPETAEGALRVGVEGPRSLKVQQDLIALGILPASAADSKYGPGTASGVRRFQESKGLVVDGLAGPNTLAALAEAVAALPPPVTTG